SADQGDAGEEGLLAQHPPHRGRPEIAPAVPGPEARRPVTPEAGGGQVAVAERVVDASEVGAQPRLDGKTAVAEVADARVDLAQVLVEIVATMPPEPAAVALLLGVTRHRVDPVRADAAVVAEQVLQQER